MDVRRYRTTATRAAMLALASTLALTPVAQAGPAQQRQDNQDDRIDQGVKEGSLTKAERAALRGQQQAIDKARDKALADDGQVGRREARRLMKAQDQASHDIYRAKHNKREPAP